MPQLEITELKREDEKAWDSYVFESGQSTFYHQIGWRNVIENTYKHKSVYLIAKEEEFLMRSMIFGKKLVSVPFGPYGGICADNETVKSALVEKPFFQKEIFGFTKEILYLIHNEEANRITEETI